MGCSYCHKTYREKRDYVFHLQANHGVGTRPQCETCGKNDFKSLSTMKLHRRQCRQIFVTQRSSVSCSLFSVSLDVYVLELHVHVHLCDVDELINISNCKIFICFCNLLLIAIEKKVIARISRLTRTCMAGCGS